MGTQNALAERADSFSTQAPDVVAALLTDGDLMVRAAAAQHAALSPLKIAQLAASPEPAIRRSVASRSDQLPDEVLRQLAADADSVVREIVAQRSDLDTDMVEALASDKRWNVRAAARPPVQPAPPTHTELASELAALLTQLVPGADQQVRADVACHPVDLSLDVLLRLCRDNDPVVRIRIAYRSQPLDAEVLALLARDPHREIRLTTAEREDLPVELRQILMTDDDERVRAAAARANS